MEKLNQKTTSLKSKFLLFLLVILFTGCASQSIGIDEKEEQPLPSLKNTNQNSINGAIYYNCLHKIIGYKFKNNKITELFQEKDQNISEVEILGDRIFFTKTISLEDVNWVGPTKIFSINKDGTNLKQHTFDNNYDFNVSVSESKNLLIYVSDGGEEATDKRYKLIQLLPDQKILYEDDVLFSAGLSPDGLRIFIRYISNKGTSIQLLDLETEKLTSVDLGYDFVNLSWHPNGKYILFSVTDEISEYYEVYLMDINTFKVEKLLDVENSLGKIIWSPDYSKILFETRNRFYVKSKLNYKLWVYDLQTNNLLLLAEDSGDNMPGNSGFSPDWSLDGEYITYFSTEVGQTTISQHFINSEEYTEILRLSLPCSMIGSIVWVENE